MKMNSNDHSDGVVGLRCTICGLDWPLMDDYKICPSCLEKTHKFSETHPMQERDAALLKLECEFERFYQEWDETHSPERLEPAGLPEYKSYWGIVDPSEKPEV